MSKEGLYALAVSPDGKHLATGSRDGITRVFELATAQLSGGFKVCTHHCSCHVADVCAKANSCLRLDGHNWLQVALACGVVQHAEIPLRLLDAELVLRNSCMH